MKRTKKDIEKRAIELEAQLKQHYKELYEGIKKEQQSNYDTLITFVNTLCLHELRRTELIMFIDRLVESFGGIEE